MDDISTLIIKVDSDGVEKANRRLNQVPGKAGKAERATDGLVSAFKRLITVAAAMAVMNKSVQIIAGFEEQMSSVKAITGATEEQFISLTETARKLGAETRYSATEAGSGMQFLAQAGFKVNEIVGAMPGVLDLATAGALDLASAADIASNILSGFNMAAEESGRVSDILAAGAANSNTNVFQLGDAMKYVAPIAQSMGVSIEETAAAIGTLSNAGLQGSMAGTGLRRVLSSLAGPTSEAADILRAYGVSLDEVNPATHSLTEIIDRLATVGISAGDALQIFGDRGAPAFLALTSQRGNLRELNGIMEQAEGTASRMAQTMGDNLVGDMKQLRSAVEEMILKGGDAGLLGVLRDGTQAVTDFVRAFNDMVDSGEVAAWADLVLSKFDLIDTGFENLVSNVTNLWELAMDGFGEEATAAGKTFVDIMMLLPENVLAAAQGIGASFGVIVEYASASGKGIYDAFVSWFNYLIDTAKNVGREIASHFPGNEDFDYIEAQAASYEKFASSIGGSWDTVTAKIGNATAAWEEQIVAIMDEWDANTAASDDKIARIEEIRAAYKKLKKDREEAEGTGSDAPVSTTANQPTGQERFLTREFDELRKALQDQELTVKESYERRLELIRKNTEEGSDLRIDLERSLNEQLSLEMESANQATADRLEQLHIIEQEKLQVSLDNREITEEEFRQRSIAAWNDYVNKLGEISTTGSMMVATKHLEIYSNVLDMAAGISDQLSGLVKDNSDAAKAMFIASKAIAIAQAIVNTELAATQALTAGPFLGIPMSTLVRATGYASVALIAAQSVMDFQGRFEHGGRIGSGKWGIAGEAGAELVRGPAVITSARTTADLMSGSGSGVHNEINIINQVPGTEIERRERDTSEGKVIDLIVKQAQRRVAEDIDMGSGPVSSSLGKAFGLRRGTA